MISHESGLSLLVYICIHWAGNWGGKWRHSCEWVLNKPPLERLIWHFVVYSLLRAMKGVDYVSVITSPCAYANTSSLVTQSASGNSRKLDYFLPSLSLPAATTSIVLVVVVDMFSPRHLCVALCYSFMHYHTYWTELGRKKILLSQTTVVRTVREGRPKMI